MKKYPAFPLNKEKLKENKAYFSGQASYQT